MRFLIKLVVGPVYIDFTTSAVLILRRKIEEK